MRIEIDKLQELDGKLSEVYETDELPLGETDVRLSAPAKVQGRIRREGNEVQLRGRLDAEIEVACGRCLNAVSLPIHSLFAERFVPAVKWRDEEQHELEPEDLNLAVFNGESIDLDEIVREQILLAVPAHVLCREDCQGLCPVCGANGNLQTCQCEEKETDSRWQKLKELQM